MKNTRHPLYGQVLRRMYGLNEKMLWRLPFETRQGIRSVVYSMMSALLTGCASRPENNDPFIEQ